jgi:hypothetical protein
VSFKALDNFLDASLTLPVTNEKSYSFVSPPMTVGLYLQKVEAIALRQARGGELTDEDVDALNLDDDGEKNFYRMVMGATYDEMLQDNVPWHRFRVVAATVMAWITGSEEDAERMWNSFAPKAPAKKAPADRLPKKAAAPSGPADSTATTTRSRPRKTTTATRGTRS